MSDLPLSPPLEPMLAKLTAAIPDGDDWSYEPKWDGFRCLAFFDGAGLYLQSRDSKPLGRYFPELLEGLPPRLRRACVLDGEIVIMREGGLSFDALQLRLHPAASRVAKLAGETPASFVAFDLLADAGHDLRREPFLVRRARLEALTADAKPPLFLTPITQDASVARDWFERFEGAGFDGIIAKRAALPYEHGARSMAKIKHLRTADCVVGGFRWNRGEEGRSVGSLLLGLNDPSGVLQFVGHTSSFSAVQKRELVNLLRPYVDGDAEQGFGAGRTPGAQSRWSQGKDLDWVRIRPELVCEVTFDHLQGPRFRHAATFRRWRTDKPPAGCTFEQLEAPVPFELRQVFAGA